MFLEYQTYLTFSELFRTNLSTGLLVLNSLVWDLNL